jgi:hypothetical protein
VWWWTWDGKGGPENLSGLSEVGGFTGGGRLNGRRKNRREVARENPTINFQL